MARFSVVIPLYNKAAYISRAINSVLNQSQQDIEIIVIDDGSTDSGGDIVAAMTEPQIRLIRQDNRGVSAARNKGIEEAKSELIGFLDADDEWKSEFLHEINQLQENYPACGAYATSYDIVGENNQQRRNRQITGIPPHPWVGIIENFFKVRQKGLPFNGSSIVIQKKVLDEIGGFPLGVGSEEDLITWVKLGMNYSIAFSTSTQSVYHREAEGRACKIYKVRQDFTDHQIFIKKLLSEPFLDNKKREELTDYYALALLKSAKQNIKAGKPKAAKKFLDESRISRKYLFQKWQLKIFTWVPEDIFLAMYKSRQIMHNIIRSGFQKMKKRDISE